MDKEKYFEYKTNIEGKIVRRYNNSSVTGETICHKCGHRMSEHGWIETLEGNNGGQDVCPGNWIITGINGEYYPCKPIIF